MLYLYMHNDNGYNVYCTFLWSKLLVQTGYIIRRCPFIVLVKSLRNISLIFCFLQKTIPYTEAVSITTQNVGLQEPLAAPTKELDDTQYIHQTKSTDTVNMNVQGECVVEDFVVDADRVRNINALVEEMG